MRLCYACGCRILHTAVPWQVLCWRCLRHFENEEGREDG